MKVGFTGTRHGMTDAQKCAVYSLLKSHMPTEFHHGDCVGADEQAHGLAFEANGLDTRRIVHPPMKESLRAFCEADDSRTPASYLTRNRDIVDETDALIAAPREDQEPAEAKGGTWYTVNYARRVGKPILIVLPSGAVVHEGAEVV